MAPRRFFEKQDSERQQESRSRSDVKRKPPAVDRSQVAAEQVARSRSHRDRQIKHTENAAALLFRKKIRNEGGRNGDEGRFADSDQRVAYQQFRVGMRDSGQQRECTPEDGAEGDDQLARIPIRQRTDKRRSHHVESQKRTGEVADLRLRQVKLGLHQRLHGKQHIPVRVVEQIQRGEHEQRGAGIELLLGHGWWLVVSSSWLLVASGFLCS